MSYLLFSDGSPGCHRHTELHCGPESLGSSALPEDRSNTWVDFDFYSHTQLEIASKNLRMRLGEWKEFCVTGRTREDVHVELARVNSTVDVRKLGDFQTIYGPHAVSS